MLKCIRRTICSLSLKQLSFIHTTPVANESLTVVTENDGVREIILNQPKTRHTLSMAMMDSIIDGLSKNLDDNSVRCIVLSSTGPVFSAGHNLNELTADKGAACQRAVFVKCAEMIRAIQEAPVPVIAKVDGLATAGGFQLVASCDMLVCSDKSHFACAAANFGLFCHTPGVALARVMPRMRAMYMLFTGFRINAKDAFTSGLASIVVPSDELDQEVEKICDAIKSKSRPVIKLGKEFYYKQMEMNINDAYEEATEVMVKNLGLNDGKEGIQCFVEKRKPKWTHS